MARLPYVEAENATDDVKQLYNGLEELAGRVLNPVKMVAHSPKLLQSWWAMMMTLIMELKLEAKLREIVLMRIFQLVGCKYCWSEHVRIALESGLTQTQLDNLEQYPTHESFSELERLALQYAEKITLENDVDDEVFKALQQHLSDQEMVELTFCIGNWNGIARFIVPMGLELETAGE